MVKPKLEKYFKFREEELLNFRLTAERKVYEDIIVMAERAPTIDFFEVRFGYYFYKLFISLMISNGSEKEKYLWTVAGYRQEVVLSYSVGVIANLKIGNRVIDVLCKDKGEKYLKDGWTIGYEFLNITELFHKVTGIHLNIVID